MLASFMIDQQERKMVPILFLHLYLVVVCCTATADFFKPKIDLCSGEDFHCGNRTCISYPFWGDERAPSCGLDDHFRLNCRDNVTMIEMHPLSYRVQMIDFRSSSVRVARHDMWNTTCPPILLNTTLNSEPYEFDNRSDLNITLFFNCTGHRPPSNFSCHGINSFFNYFSVVASPNVTCVDSIYVPMNRTKAGSALASSSVKDLQEALAFGFSIRWQSSPLQYTPPYCNKNSGICSSTTDSSTQRNCSDNFRCLPQVDNGPPPIQSRVPAVKNGTSTTPAGGNPVPKKEIIIVVLSVVGVIALSTIIIISWCVKRQYHQDTNLETVLLQHGSLALKRYSYSKVKKMTKSLSDKIGQGGYGSVYKGMLPNGRLVAVKILGETEGGGEGFINEVGSISRTSHVNIVNLLGFCYERNKRALIYEYMPNKSLDKFMRDSRSPGTPYTLDFQMLYNIAMGVAKGLEYLHTGCNTRIVHFDIKPQNILLDEDFCPKISDFGLAKLCKKKQSVMSMLGARGTIGYIAPEIYSRNFGRPSYKSDVYSYGMMVIEMVGATTSDMETDDYGTIQSSETNFPDQIYEQLMVDIARNLDEGQQARKLLLVGLWCIQTSPSDRPPMSKVVEMLEGSIEGIQIPPKPFLCHPTLSTEDLSTSVSVYVETEDSTTLE